MKKPKENLNMSRKVNTDSIQLAPPITTQCPWIRAMNNRKIYTLPYAPVTKQKSYAPTNIEQEPHRNQSHQQTDMQELKNVMVKLFLKKLEI
jgi:hypothetical protein